MTFEEGERTKKKRSPKSVEEEMIQLTQRFEFSERLPAKKIRNFFSTLAAKQRKSMLKGRINKKKKKKKVVKMKK